MILLALIRIDENAYGVQRRLKSGAAMRFLLQEFMQLASDSKQRVSFLRKSVNPRLKEEDGRNDTSASLQRACAKFATPGVRLSSSRRSWEWPNRSSS
jgi:hypothetical protein